MMKRMILALAVVAALGVSGPAQAASFVGGQTDVIFDAGAAGLFASVAPVGTATQNGLTFSFPVTGGTDSPLLIEHNGSGLELGNTTNDKLQLRNFLINGSSLTVFGNAFLNGSAIAGGAALDLFTIVPVGNDLRLALTNTSAGALNGFLGITALQAGLQIATAVPQPQVPEPASILLMGSALALALRRRLR